MGDFGSMKKIVYGNFGTQNSVEGAKPFFCIEKLSKFNNPDGPNYDEFKSDVFSLGMSYLVAS
jgi:hypothetical protein